MATTVNESSANWAMLALGLGLAAGCSNSSNPGFVIPPPTLFGDGGVAETGAGPACTSESLGAKHRPLDLFLVQDISGSMAGIPWAMCKASLEDFFMNPPSTDMSAALTFFPIPGVGDTVCSRSDYALFVVGIGPLPAQAPKLAAALEATTPIGGTPTQPALDGALLTATAYKAAHADHQVAAVLISDGLPNNCSDPNQINTLPKAALEENGTLTFTIAIGTAGASAMDEIAAAGGTGKSLTVGDASQIGNSLRKAQLEAVGCELVFPRVAPSGKVIDPNLVNVIITDDLGPRTIPQVASLASCGNQEGWYYDDPKNPTLILLCPGSCGIVQSKPTSALNATFGCLTEAR